MATLQKANMFDFYSRPCGRGDRWRLISSVDSWKFLLTPLREGRPGMMPPHRSYLDFYSRPCGRGDQDDFIQHLRCPPYFYSRPCGRGDLDVRQIVAAVTISTHAPAGGATALRRIRKMVRDIFLLTPLREGRLRAPSHTRKSGAFLLTPLREGRLLCPVNRPVRSDFYSRPCGRGDILPGASAA